MSIAAPEFRRPSRCLGRLLIAAILSVLLSTSRVTLAQEAGTCEPGQAQTFLDANNVRAAIYNGGNMFWRGSGNVYTVPKTGLANSIFAANLWIGGMVGDELRFSGSDYGPFAFLPGPLTEQGELPNPSDCSSYDRIFEITRLDLEHFEATGVATEDIRDWPWHLGAPVTDGDGNPDNYDLTAGDRPEITGHEMHWWVMNDLSGSNRWGKTPPLGIEVRASAFAVMSEEPALNNTTFYRYIIRNPQAYAIDSVYVGLWLDTDLGHAGDDHVGSDTSLGMAFSYNGDDFDDFLSGYGEAPPAIGFDFVQGPRGEHDGEDNDRDGEVDEVGERQSMSAFMFYHGSRSPTGNPTNGLEAYRLMKAYWVDGSPLTEGGTGYRGDIRTRFMWAGDPVTRSFWSEENTNGSGARNTPSDRRFIMSTGPFDLVPGAAEEIVIASVWARGSDRLDSVSKLREADRIVQEVWDAERINDVDEPPRPAHGPELLSPARDVEGQPVDPTLEWLPQEHAAEYLIEIATNPDFTGPSVRRLTTTDSSIDVAELEPFTDYFWRVRTRTPLYVSPHSTTGRFATSDVEHGTVGIQLIPGTDQPAFVEVRGPGGIDSCGFEASSKDGCTETGGNFVYGSENSTGEFIMHHLGSTGPASSIADFAPNDYEIRFTERGSYAIHFFSTGTLIDVPFEIWDVGPVGFFAENDPSDDVRLIPTLFSNLNGECDFAYGEWESSLREDWGVTDRVYAYYAANSYEEWEQTVEPLVNSTEQHCYAPADHGEVDYVDHVDFERRPLQRITFHGDPNVAAAPREGTIIRFYTTPPPEHSPLQAAPAVGTGPISNPCI